MTRQSKRACGVLVERLSAYLDGDLGPAACDRIQAHARTCTRCAKLIAGLQQTVGICHKAAKAPLPAAVRARARDYIRELLGPELRQRAEGKRQK
jgi:anti-sigma factor RsiW